MGRLFRHEFRDILENKTHESPEDVYAMKQMEESIHFDEEIGHYRVGLPWKTSREEVAEKMNKVNSSKTSLARLKKQIQKIKRLFRHEFPDILENKTHESPEDVCAMKQMEESIHFDEEIGHYWVGLPWKTSREEVAEKMNKVNSSK